VSLPGAFQRLRGVVVSAMLPRLSGVMPGVRAVAMRDMGVVAGLFVVSGGVMLGRHAMVLRGVLVMLGGFQVVLFTFDMDSSF
jgi:hypothetical protein